MAASQLPSPSSSQTAPENYQPRRRFFRNLQMPWLGMRVPSKSRCRNGRSSHRSSITSESLLQNIGVGKRGGRLYAYT
ncbi:hypothetical protein R6Q59_028536 [Mikania micrantha]